MRNNFKLIFIFCVLLLSTDSAFSFIRINESDSIIRLIPEDKVISGIPPYLNLQREDAEIYSYGQGVIDKLLGRSIRTTIGWIKEWADKNSDVEVIIDHYPPFFAIVDFESDTPEEREQSYNSQFEEYNRYAFSFYPLITEEDIQSLFKEKKIILVCDITMMSNSEIYITVRSFAPNPSKGAMTSSSSKPNDKDYIEMSLYYIYSLGWPTEDSPEEVREKILKLANQYCRQFSLSGDKRFTKELKKHQASLVLQHFIDSFKWNLKTVRLFNFKEFNLSDINSRFYIKEIKKSDIQK